MYFNENEQARQILEEIGNLPQFNGAINVNPSAIIKGFKSKRNLHTFVEVTCNIWTPNMEELDYSN